MTLSESNVRNKHLIQCILYLFVEQHIDDEAEQAAELKVEMTARTNMYRENELLILETIYHFNNASS